MVSRSNFIVQFLLLLAVCVPGTALNFPLFPNISPVMCTVADAPWYLCDQSDRLDEEAIPNFYNRISTFFGLGDENETFAEEGEDGGVRRQLRKGYPPKQE